MEGGARPRWRVVAQSWARSIIGSAWLTVRAVTSIQPRRLSIDLTGPVRKAPYERSPEEEPWPNTSRSSSTSPTTSTL
jgi:hypothetical protein